MKEERFCKSKISKWIAIILALAGIISIIVGIVTSAKKEVHITDTSVAETIEEDQLAEEATAVEIVKEQEATTESVEEVTSEVEEIVDWETWATQSENDDICMVVWNEKNGTQKILRATPKGCKNLQEYSYTVEEGDRFAVPKRDNIKYVVLNLKSYEYFTEEQNYMELELEPGEKVQINIISYDINEQITYLFNF